jgi:hypothetical protein
MKKKIFIGVIVTLTLVLLSFGYAKVMTILDKKNSYDGVITFNLIDSNNEVKINDQLEYKKDQSLFDLLNENYTVTTLPNFQYFIIGIDEYITDSKTTFFAIYVNDEFASKGANLLFLKDKDIVTFKIERTWGS